MIKETLRNKQKAMIGTSHIHYINIFWQLFFEDNTFPLYGQYETIVFDWKIFILLKCNM